MLSQTNLNAVASRIDRNQQFLQALRLERQERWNINGRDAKQILDNNRGLTYTGFIGSEVRKRC